MAERVLQVTPSYPPVVGGIEDHVANLVNRLPVHGYDPVVVTPDREGVGHDQGVYREPTRVRIQKSAVAPGLIRRVLTLDVDLIHAHAPFHFGLEFATLASELRNVPLVVTAHMYDARDTMLYGLYESYVYNRCLDRTDAILPTTADYVDGYDAFERNRERMQPVPMSVDADRYQPVSNARQTLGWRDDEQVLLFVGAMERHHFYKDIELLIEAVANLEGIDRLVLAGSGDLVPELKRKAETECIADRVEFPGYVAEAELPTYYSAADLFVLPSKADRGEAFGIVLLEAMACGTPVLTTDIPGVRTVVGEGGLVVQPESREALQRGITTGLDHSFDPRNRVLENYTLESVVDQIVDVYESVLNN